MYYNFEDGESKVAAAADLVSMIDPAKVTDEEDVSTIAEATGTSEELVEKLVDVAEEAEAKSIVQGNEVASEHFARRVARLAKMYNSSVNFADEEKDEEEAAEGAAAIIPMLSDDTLANVDGETITETIAEATGAEEEDVEAMVEIAQKNFARENYSFFVHNANVADNPVQQFMAKHPLVNAGTWLFFTYIKLPARIISAIITAVRSLIIKHGWKNMDYEAKSQVLALCDELELLQKRDTITADDHKRIGDILNELISIFEEEGKRMGKSPKDVHNAVEVFSALKLRYADDLSAAYGRYAQKNFSDDELIEEDTDMYDDEDLVDIHNFGYDDDEYDFDDFCGHNFSRYNYGLLSRVGKGLKKVGGKVVSGFKKGASIAKNPSAKMADKMKLAAKNRALKKGAIAKMKPGLAKNKAILEAMKSDKLYKAGKFVAAHTGAINLSVAGLAVLGTGAAVAASLISKARRDQAFAEACSDSQQAKLDQLEVTIKDLTEQIKEARKAGDGDGVGSLVKKLASSIDQYNSIVVSVCEKADLNPKKFMADTKFLEKVMKDAEKSEKNFSRYYYDFADEDECEDEECEEDDEDVEDEDDLEDVSGAMQMQNDLMTVQGLDQVPSKNFSRYGGNNRFAVLRGLLGKKYIG